MFRFAYQQFLFLLILVPALAVFFMFAFRQKKRAMAVFGNMALMEKLAGSVSRTRQRWKAALLILAAGFLVLSMARPQLGTKLRTVKREGQDISGIPF